MNPQDKHTFNNRWPMMRPHLIKLLRQQDISHPDWQGLFWDIHSVCLWDDKGTVQLYSALKSDITEYIADSQKRVLENQEDHALLKAYIREWRRFFAQCGYLPLPFSQCDAIARQKLQQYGLQVSNASSKRVASSNQSEVRQMMLVSWNECIFQNIRTRLQSAALKLIEAERNGEAFDTQLVIGVRESYVNLTADPDAPLEVYRTYFEEPYLTATTEFYMVKAQAFLQDNGVHAYMRYAEQKLKEEEARGARYLETSADSAYKLRKCLVDELIIKYMDVILAECPALIRANDTEKLALMFKLMDYIGQVQEEDPERGNQIKSPDTSSEDDASPGIVQMLAHMHEFIVQQGLADMRANADTITQDCEKYVEALLELFNRFSNLVEEAANNDPRFLSTRDKAFEEIVNNCSIFTIHMPQGIQQGNRSKVGKTSPESRCPELLANYSDMLLRRTALSKRLTSEEIDNKLADVLTLLRYVKNKDVFMRYHKYHLTRRLILDISADNEKEENMVEDLRNVGMPADYINNMLRMFQDIKLSQDLNQEFKEFKEGPAVGAVASGRGITDVVNIKILNVGSWVRSTDIVPVSLPIELEDLIPEVEDFYKQKHGGRKLQWHHHMANGTVTFSNRVGKFDLEITTLQMAVLFAWNQRPLDKISFEGLRLATELPDSELRRTLHCLVCFPKLKKQLLCCDLPDLKTPKDFNDSTNFWVNQEFCLIKNGKVQKRGRVNLIGRLQLASEKAAEENHQEIAVLRELRTEEGIMKIMKMRKRISYAQLQTELVEILKGQFAPSRKLIKECIEKLINNNHVQRSDLDLNEYIYVA
ncbi:cullin-5-like isoform X2 [Varroa jacobsoni]|uniref:Cullin-5 n=1 Tax=Varroa destructor TaxID=109461 RepID=A0A7M7JI71_VARDE|nr:cullin-5-like isoform X2 [Varroa destructor]XP_022698211.1 cullin-5-like isoform X2 [Varroa jacobsoni]